MPGRLIAANDIAVAGGLVGGVLSSGYPQLTNRCAIPNNASAGTEAKTTYRLRYYAPKAFFGGRLVYANVICNSSGSENVATTPITITAAVEYPQGVVTPITFNGATSVTIAAGALAISDPCGVDIPDGGILWVRTCVAQGGSTIWPLNTQTVYDGNNIAQDGDGVGLKINGATNASPIVITSQNGDHQFQTGDTAVISGVTGNTAANGTWTVTRLSSTTFSLQGSTGNGAYTGNGVALGNDLTKLGSGLVFGSGGANAFGPVAIIGNLKRGTRQPWVTILGDSIAQGSGDTSNAGYIVRGLGGPTSATIPYMNLAVPGTRATQFADLTNAPTQSERRRKLGLTAPYVIIEYVTNDYSNGRTLAQIQADNLAIATNVQTRGGRALLTTCLPKTTSTDSWATAGNQTPAANESIRTGYNDWVRAGCPIVNGVAVAVGTAGALTAGQAGHPVWMTCDPTAYCEVNASNVLTVNGGRFLTNGSANWPTSDGTHPTSNITTLAAASIPVAQMVAY